MKFLVDFNELYPYYVLHSGEGHNSRDLIEISDELVTRLQAAKKELNDVQREIGRLVALHHITR